MENNFYAAELRIGDNAYPQRLDKLKNPPELLYVRGKMNLAKAEPCVAVVGTRNPTAYGLTVTADFCRDFCEAGFTIVTGGARGIDTAAAQTALKYGGKLILVLGCGVDVVYPPENEGLFSATVESGGAIISELPPGTQPHSGYFPMRNRIIAGLCDGCLVTEAGAKSGALITADICFDLRRPVFAVPGNITSGQSAGTNELIRSGAQLVTDGLKAAAEMKLSLSFADRDRIIAAEKVSTESPVSLAANPKKEKKAIQGLSPTEEKIIAAMEGGCESLDDISKTSGLNEADLAPTLVMLEIKGVIRRNFGGGYTVI